MAFIKINPEGMLTVINNLDERADGIATERKKINDSSRDNHDPVPSVDLATSPTSYPSFVDRARDRELSAPVPRLCTVWLKSCAPAARRPST